MIVDIIRKTNNDEIIHSKKIKLSLVLYTKFVLTLISASIGSAFIHGWNLGVTNPPEQVLRGFIENCLHQPNGVVPSPTVVTSTFALMVSALCIGGFFGAFLVAPVSRNFGRKGGLMFNAIFILLGGFCMGFAKYFGRYELLIIGRGFAGVHAGLGAGIAPLYFNEISPHQWRGAVGTIYQLVVVISILLSQILGLEGLLGNEEYWPYLLGGIVLCPVIMVVLLPCCPESPKFLLSKNLVHEARVALSVLRGTPNVQEDFNLMSQEADIARKLPPVGISTVLHTTALKKGFVVSIVVMTSQQLSGINAVIFFSTRIFISAGLSPDAAGMATVGMSVVNVLSTLFSMSVIEKAGRKTLHLTGLMGMLVCTVLLTVSLAFTELHATMSWLAVGGVMAFVIMFAIGPGSIPWFLVTELIPPPAQPLASSLCVATNWFCNIGVGMAFPIVMVILGHNTFLVFTVFLAIFYVYIYRNLPETKGRTIDEISTFFSRAAVKM